MYESDTIAARATAPGEGGIAIVRVSGPEAEGALSRLFSPAHAFESHKMYYGHIVFQGETLDECMAVLMRSPRSYTREDVAEIHLHGGDWAAGSVLNALYSLGVRPAEPGEFTKRAFLNGRVDLSRAEAVMALISAEGGRAARAAVRQLQGGVSGFIRSAQEALIALISGAAAAIDYPEEISMEEAAGGLGDIGGGGIPEGRAIGHDLNIPLIAVAAEHIRGVGPDRPDLIAAVVEIDDKADTHLGEAFRFGRLQKIIIIL